MDMSRTTIFENPSVSVEYLDAAMQSALTEKTAVRLRGGATNPETTIKKAPYRGYRTRAAILACTALSLAHGLTQGRAEDRDTHNTISYSADTFSPYSIPSVESMMDYPALPEATIQTASAQLPKIYALLPQYRKIAEQSDTPLEVVIALHYREAGNSADRSFWAGEPLGSRNPDWGDIKPVDFIENGVSAMQHLRAMALHTYGIRITGSQNFIRDIDDTTLAKIFVAYNRGSMYQKAHESELNSPYAVNGLTESMLHMTFPSGTAEPKAMRGKPDNNLGAVPLVRYLDRTLLF